MQGGGAASAGRPGRAAHGRVVGYQIIRRWSSGFLAVITIPAPASSAAWSLQFAFPGARVDRVWGARWQPSGNGDAGTAVGPVHGHSRQERELGAGQIMVSAAGPPGAPSGCVLDGVRCRFGEGSAADG
jgi:hypothetical protein